MSNGSSFWWCHGCHGNQSKVQEQSTCIYLFIYLGSTPCLRFILPLHCCPTVFACSVLVPDYWVFLCFCFVFLICYTSFHVSWFSRSPPFTWLPRYALNQSPHCAFTLCFPAPWTGCVPAPCSCPLLSVSPSSPQGITGKRLPPSPHPHRHFRAHDRTLKRETRRPWGARERCGEHRSDIWDQEKR